MNEILRLSASVERAAITDLHAEAPQRARQLLRCVGQKSYPAHLTYSLVGEHHRYLFASPFELLQPLQACLGRTVTHDTVIATVALVKLASNSAAGA